MKQKKLFRIENDLGHGMWYNDKGEFEPIIRELCPDSINAVRPMDHSDVYRTDNLVWNSSCDNIDVLNAWIPLSDLIKLLEIGFKLIEYTVSNWMELEEGEIIFARNSILHKNVLDTFRP